MIKNSLYVLFIIISFIIIYTFHITISNSEKKARSQELEAIHKRVLERFDASLDRFASMMSGVRSKVLEKEFPTQVELQSFLKNELYALDFKDSLIVSYLDTNHTFIYSFDAQRINPSNLIGKTVYELRDSLAIKRLNKLLSSDKLKLFPPINLYEGWVGIPINFSVKRNDSVSGYIASIINFKNIIEPIYSVESKKIAFMFSVKGGATFDREIVHDKSKIYHDRIDEEYFAFFDIEKEQFIESEYEKFGLKFIIGTAYKDTFKTNPMLVLMYGCWCLFLIIAWGSSIYNLKEIVFVNNKLTLQNTTIKKQSLELEKKNKSLKEYAHIVSHDLKAPLRNINTLISWLQEDDYIIKNEDSEKYVNHIESNLLKMENLIVNILKYSELDNNQLKQESINLNKIINTIINESSILENKKIEVIIKKELPKFNGEKVKLEQLFQNLFSNAIKYNDKEICEIEIDFEVVKNGYRFCFKDNGIGIDEKYHHKVFEVFNKLNLDTQNSGIGLAIVDKIVKYYNGNISVESKLGKETVFYFTLFNK
jgi:nitrogen-specific signal transduction histidine kinase